MSKPKPTPPEGFQPIEVRPRVDAGFRPIEVTPYTAPALAEVTTKAAPATDTPKPAAGTKEN